MVFRNYWINNRLPSNLRPTTRECTRECVHLVTRGHFRSRDKDGGHAVRSAVLENPVLQADITALCLIERELMPVNAGRSFTLRE